MADLDHYAYGSARALVALHDRHLRSFMSRWHHAHASGVTLPTTEDPDCETLESLLFHVLGCAGGYMVWICKQLQLPDPEIDPAPTLDTIVEQADQYLEHVLERWRLPLAAVPGEAFDRPTYPSSWGVDYCIDAMLEHAVMHAIRHELQIERASG